MNALIVDDEFMPAEYLETLIQRHCPEITHITVFTDSIEALKHLGNHAVGILFLDIEMPGMSGFDLIESIPAPKLPPVVFTTAYNKYAIRAFDNSAVHYLLKPVEPAKLREAVQRVAARQETGMPEELSRVLGSIGLASKTITLPEGQDYHVVKVNQVIRVEGSGSYCIFHFEDARPITVSKRLKVYADRLDQFGFIRTHQSHLVNPAFIARYSKSDGGFIVLNNGDTLPVSPAMKNEVKAKLGL